MIYFDSTATTHARQEVIDAYLKVNSTYWHNPSSAYTLGVKASQLLAKTIDVFKETLNLKDFDVLFTHSATEANNIAIKGVCDKYIGEKMRIITTQIEHPSVYNVFKHYEELGFDVKYLSVDEYGLINLDELKSLMTKNTILVSIMKVNNIVGTIEPIIDALKIVRDFPRCKFHTDLVQAVGKISLGNLNDFDLMTISSHKIEGLKGTAALLKKKNLELTKVLNGADQQLGLVPGTIDLAGAVAMTKALKLAISEQKESLDKVTILHDYLIEELKKLDGITINSNEYCSKYIISFSYEPYKAETLLHFLEAKDIYVSVGSACAAHKETPERTIFAMFKDQKRALSSIRVSLSKHTTKEDINELIKELKEFKKVRKNV